MIQVKKTRKSKNRLAIIVVASVLALLSIGVCVIWYFMNNKPTETNPPASEGTDFYPGVASGDVTGFEVLFPKKEEDKQSYGAILEDGTYYFFYYTADGERVLYNPDINYEEPGFLYSSLYAIAGDGMNVPKISYVLYALAETSYNDKIEIPDLNEAEREEALRTYGLDKENRKAVSFTYTQKVKKDDGTEETKTFGTTVYVGNKLVTNTGYYLMIDYPNTDEYKEKREETKKYVYISFGAENYSHALDGFSSFIAPNLVMGGNLANNDKVAYSQLTPAYRQWKSIVYNKASDKVREKTEVIITANVYSPAYAIDSDGTPSIDVGESGYFVEKNLQTTIDLEHLANNPIYKNFINAIVGKNVGDYKDNKISPIIITDQNEASLGKTYKYTIYEIESVIDNNGIEHFSGSAANYSQVKVRYSCTVDGKEVIYKDAAADKLHAVIDLTDTRIPEDVRNKIKSLSVGTLSAPIEFETVYTESTTSSTLEFRIQRITNVINAETGMAASKITDNTIVSFVYQILHNGSVTSESTMTFDLSKDEDEMDDLQIDIKEALLGAKLESTGVYEKDITAYKTTVYYQAFKSFMSYSISSIDYFVDSEEVVSFRYANPTERDPFYGEAIHINTLQNHKYSSYALDWIACDRVIKILSGTLEGTSSTIFEGLTGDKVVAVGLTPENMEKYGLYAYTVYYEIPRYVESEDIKHNGADVTEYSWWDAVGFTLYISETNVDGKRYVGSDMYDIVVEIDGETFDFVEETFVDFWARRDIFMVDQSKINDFDATFNLTGFTGKYSFTLEHPTMWVVNYTDGKTGITAVKPADDATNVVDKTDYQATYVYVKPLDFEGATNTLLLERYRIDGAFPGKDGIHIHSIYDYRYQNGLSTDKQTVGYDYLGDSSFKDVLYILYGTGYLGTLTESEANEALKNEPVMSLKMNVEGSTLNNVYNFYYTADGRVAVELDDGARQTCYFYITNHSFKMVINAFINLLNGKTVDFTGSYPNS